MIFSFDHMTGENREFLHHSCNQDNFEAMHVYISDLYQEIH